MARRSTQGAMAAPTSSALAKIAAIPPPAGSDCMSRPRSAISRSASSSVSTPATHAATYSPTEWPMTTFGRRPHERQSSASAYSTAKSAGWVNASH